MLILFNMSQFPTRGRNPNQTWTRQLQFQPYTRIHPNENVINRPQPLQPTYRTRMVNFDAVRAKKISEEGLKVSLSDKTIKELVNVNIPDPKDKELSKIENRAQKTISVTADIVNNNFKLADKINVLQSAIDQNLYASSEQRNEILKALYLIIKKADEENVQPEILFEDNEIMFNEISEINIPQLDDPDIPTYINNTAELFQLDNDTLVSLKTNLASLPRNARLIMVNTMNSKLAIDRRVDVNAFSNNAYNILMHGLSNNLVFDTQFYTFKTSEEVAEDLVMDNSEKSGFESGFNTTDADSD